MKNGDKAGGEREATAAVLRYQLLPVFLSTNKSHNYSCCNETLRPHIGAAALVKDGQQRIVLFLENEEHEEESTNNRGSCVVSLFSSYFETKS